MIVFIKLNILIKTGRQRKGPTSGFELVIAKGLQICQHPTGRFFHIFLRSRKPKSVGRWSFSELFPRMPCTGHRGILPFAPEIQGSQLCHWHKFCSRPVELSLDGTHVARTPYTRVHRPPHTYPTVLNKEKVSITNSIVYSKNLILQRKHV